MSDTILTNDAIRSRIKDAVHEAVGRWPTDKGVEKVLDTIYEEAVDPAGWGRVIQATAAAKRGIRDFKDFLRLPSAQNPNRCITCGPVAVALIALARETEGPERGGQVGMWGKVGAGRDGGAGL
jgi:hypothetical protein